jgi:hypothetical protein
MGLLEMEEVGNSWNVATCCMLRILGFFQEFTVLPTSALRLFCASGCGVRIETAD